VRRPPAPRTKKVYLIRGVKLAWWKDLVCYDGKPIQFPAETLNKKRRNIEMNFRLGEKKWTSMQSDLSREEKKGELLLSGGGVFRRGGGEGGGSILLSYRENRKAVRRLIQRLDLLQRFTRRVFIS